MGPTGSYHDNPILWFRKRPLRSSEPGSRDFAQRGRYSPKLPAKLQICRSRETYPSQNDRPADWKCRASKVSRSHRGGDRQPCPIARTDSYPGGMMARSAEVIDLRQAAIVRTAPLPGQLVEDRRRPWVV